MAPKQVRRAIEELPDGKFRILEPAVVGRTVVVVSGTAPRESNDPSVRIVQAEDSLTENLEIQQGVRKVDAIDAAQQQQSRVAATVEREQREKEERDKPSHGKT